MQAWRCRRGRVERDGPRAPQDVKLDVAGIGGDGGEIALGVAVAARQRLDVLFEAGDGEGACRLEDGASVLEGVAYGRADLVVAHHDDVVNQLIAHAEGLRGAWGGGAEVGSADVQEEGEQRQWLRTHARRGKRALSAARA